MQLFRLSADRCEDLRWFFNDAEANAGLRSNLGSTSEMLAMGLFGTGGSRRAFDAMPDHCEAGRRRAWGLHRCVQRLQSEPEGVRHVRVLYRVYGPSHWRVVFAFFEPAELAPLVEDTGSIARLVEADPRLTKAAAVEHCLQAAQKSGPAFLRKLEREASEMLSAASQAFQDAYDATLRDRRRAA